MDFARALRRSGHIFEKCIAKMVLAQVLGVVSRNDQKGGLVAPRRHAGRADSQSLWTNQRRITLGRVILRKGSQEGHKAHSEPCDPR